MSHQIKIQNISTSHNISMLKALEIMDEHSVKLLMLCNNGKFKGLLSIGDIQRAIIKNIPLNTEVYKITRDTNLVCNSSDSLEDIKQKMLSYRTEFMPLIDSDNNIIDVVFWNDIIEDDSGVNKFDKPVPVVIMAGGFGTRLKPITNVIPKPLIPIGDKTILEEIISKFEQHGSNEFYLTVNYKSDFIKFFFDTQINKKYNIVYLNENTPLGTAGSLFLSKPYLNETFFVSNCDIVINENYCEIYNYHKQKKNTITLVASLKTYKIPYGTVETGEDGKLLELKEKPELVFKINTGMYVLEPEALDYIEDNQFLHITDLMDTIKSSGGKVGVFPISEKSWYDIGEWSEYNKIIEKYL